MSNEIKPTFQVGEVVQLRSGGPLSCVTYTNDQGLVSLIYFNNVDGHFAKFSTNQDCLKHANTVPQTPRSAENLRNTTVAKSSLS